jgi:hypothetical protein
MKNIITLVVLVFCTTVLVAQKTPESRTKIAIASYNGSSTDVFFFTNNASETELRFTAIELSASQKYNLNDNSFIGKFFRVTYRVDFLPNKEVKSKDKMASAQSPYKKTFTIIDLEELPDYNEEDEEKEDKDDDGIPFPGL